MKLVEIFDKNVWDDFVITHGSQFLQSWEWGEFQKKIGRDIVRFAIKHNNDIVLCFLLIKYNLVFKKNYLYIPCGPVINKKLLNNKVLDFFTTQIRDISKKQNSVFIRFEPRDSEFNILNTKTVDDIQPKQTVILNLLQSQDEILANMHSKTRYNINIAKKHNVDVFESKNIKKHINVFLSLLYKTTKRDKFKPHPNSYYKEFLNLGSGFTKLYLAKYKDKILASYIVVYFGNTVIYVHGASSHEYKNVMASYILHWYIIKNAKDAGYKNYDFWGIDNKKWPGLTRFKTGFSKNIIIYPGTFDLPIRRFWYLLYKLGKLIKL